MIGKIQLIETILLVIITILISTMINQQIETHEKIEQIQDLLTKTSEYLLESDIEIINY